MNESESGRGPGDVSPVWRARARSGKRLAAIEPGDVERPAADLGIGPDPGSTFVTPTAVAPVPPSPVATAPHPMDTTDADATVVADLDGFDELVLADEVTADEQDDFDSLSFSGEPLEFALEEGELSMEDGEELESVYVELIDE